MSLAHVKYERVTWVSPLGLKFCDVALKAPVISGLIVKAYPPSALESLLANSPKGHNSTVAVTAAVSPSGIYGFAHLPGLRDFEIGRGDDKFWQQPLPRRTYVISVVDTLKRFLPCVFEVEAPMRNLTEPGCLVESPPASPPGFDIQTQGIPLFSSPARAMSNIFAIIRADLLDADTGQPASWAILEAGLNSKPIAWSVADEKGKVVLFFPYPELQEDSPPTRKPLRNQSWILTIKVKYSLLTPGSPPEFHATTQRERERPVPLRHVLNQNSAELLQSLSPFIPLTETQLKFGQECILKSQLWVQPS